MSKAKVGLQFEVSESKSRLPQMWLLQLVMLCCPLWGMSKPGRKPNNEEGKFITWSRSVGFNRSSAKKRQAILPYQ